MPVINGPMPIEHVWRYRILFVGGIFVTALGTMMGSWKVIFFGIGMLGLYGIIGDEDMPFWQRRRKGGGRDDDN